MDPLAATRPRRRAGFWTFIDWPLIVAAMMLSLLGLVTMYSFGVENTFFDHQIIWLSASAAVFLVASMFDYRFLRQSWPVAVFYGINIIVLALIYVVGSVALGARSRFNVGAFAIQPADLTMIVTIIVLAKYFARRHIDIAQFRHIFISGIYALIPLLLILLQPDLGSAIILASIWFGMVLVSGISKKHLLIVITGALIVGTLMWSYGLHDYQKLRILTFLHPLSDIQGAGYNAYQSIIAVGAGKLEGRGIGYGTQSKLRFLPEYQTDFIFAAFAEEWGLLGVLLLFGLYAIVVWRILLIAMRGGSNFEILFGVGLTCLIMSHFIVHVGINLGLLPVTGTTIPFMSYGGSHLIAEYLGLGMLMGMRRYSRVAQQDVIQQDFVPTVTTV